MSRIERIGDFYSFTSNYKFISFDLFDTVIRRRFLNVHQVHDCASAYALALLGQRGNISASDLTSMRYRMGAALKAAPELSIEEPRLADVWDRVISQFQKKHDPELCRDMTEKVVRFEFEIDKSNLAPIDGVVELLDNLRAAGKTVIAISDMYFSAAQMSNILDKLDLLKYFDHIFVSAELNATKQTGELFVKVMNQLDIGADELIHVGDNIVSDVEMATNLGINAILVDQTELLKLELPEYGKREQISQDVADLVKAHLYSVLFDVLDRDATQIYFMARDGIAIQDFLDAWSSPLRDAFLPTPGHQALVLNRTLMCWSNVDFSSEWLASAVGWAFWLKEGEATRHEIAEILGVDPVLPEAGDGKLAGATYQLKLADAYREAGLEEAIKREIIAKRRVVQRYLEGVGFYSHRAVALSDVGYSGTVGRALNTILLQLSAEGSTQSPPSVRLHLIASGANFLENSRFAQPHCSFAEQVIVPYSAQPPELSASYAWLEYFFKHPNFLPIKRFTEQDGEILPELRLRKQPLDSTPMRELLSHAADDPADLVLLWMAATNQFGDLAQPVLARFSDPDRDTLKQMQAEIYELDPIEGTTRRIFLELPSARNDTIEALARRQDYWVSGSIAASRLAEQDTEAAAEQRGTAKFEAKKSLARSSWWRRLLGAARFKTAPQAPKGFELDFYRSFYPDLASIKSDEELTAHFLRHGRQEQRFGSPEAFKKHLEVEFGQMPDNFDHEAYLFYNPDVAVNYGTPERALDHFMRHGRHEGRQFQMNTLGLERDMRALVHRGVIVLSEAEQARVDREKKILPTYLDRFGLVPGVWLEKIDVVEFAALNDNWAGQVTNRAEVLVALLERGIERTPSLSLADPFEPDYLRAAHPHLANEQDDAIYQWVLPRPMPMSEQAALRQIWYNSEFPRAFNWKAWQSKHLRALEGKHRTEVLRHFLAAPGTQRIGFIEGDGAPELLEFLGGQAHLFHALYEDADTYYSEAIAMGGNAGWFEHLRGDLWLAAGQTDRALVHFRTGIATETPNQWSFLHAAELLLKKGAIRTAVEILERARDDWKQFEPWRALWRVAQQGQIASSLGRFCANPCTLSPLRDLDDVMRRFDGEKPDRPIVADKRDATLILTGRKVNVPDWLSTHDRSKVVGMSTIHDRTISRHLLGYSRLILHEVPLNCDTLEAIAHARALGCKVICWLGDIFDHEGGALSVWVSDADGCQRGTLNRSSAWELCLLARYCDEVVTGIAGLLPVLVHCAPDVPARFTPRQNGLRRDELRDAHVTVVLVPQNADAAALKSIAAGLEQAAEREPSSIFYVDASIKQHVSDAISDDRVRVVPWETELQTLADLIEQCDTVVQFVSDCDVAAYLASEEAMRRGRCSRLLKLEPRLETQRNGPQERAKAEHLVAPEAFQWAALANMLLSREMPEVTPAIDIAKPGSRVAKGDAAASDKRRIMFVNVWFPPQTIGGATKVLADNVDYLLDNHTGEFDLQVFASDEHNARTGELSLGHYRGVPVFRFATPQQDQIYWRPDLALANSAFEAIIRHAKPDMVHFHCLQRLGAGLLEVCKRHHIPYAVTLHDGWWLSDYPFMTDPEGRYFPARRDPATSQQSKAVTAIASLNRNTWLRSALMGATRRFAVSERFAEMYRSCEIPCEVLENGASRLPMRPRIESEGKLELLHLGGLERHKGAFLIEAALRTARLENLRVTVIDLAREESYQRTTTWGASEVIIRGRQSANALARLYAASHVLVAPSICEESFGLVTREALQHGLWVVAGDRGAIAEPIREGINGYIVDVAGSAQLGSVFALLNAEPHRFKTSPPVTGRLRTADDQSRELVSVYRNILGTED